MMPVERNNYEGRARNPTRMTTDNTGNSNETRIGSNTGLPRRLYNNLTTKGNKRWVKEHGATLSSTQQIPSFSFCPSVHP